MKSIPIRLRTLFAAVLSVVIVEILGAGMIHVWDVSALAVLGFIRVLEITVLFIIVNRCEGGASQIGLDPGRIPAGIRRGIFWSLAIGFFTGLCTLILYGFGVNPFQLIKTPLPESMLQTILYCLVGGIIGPVAEEIFFRGFIFQFFRQWGFLPALIISTTVFTLLHPLSSGVPLPQIAGGLLFAAALEVEKNLTVPIVVHITGNCAIFALSLITL